MTVKELKHILEDTSDDLEVMVGCLDRNGDPIKSPAWSVLSIDQTTTTCVLEISHDPR